MPLPGSPFYNPRPTFLDDSGDPLAGGRIYTYEAGTTTPLALYTDVDLTVPASNPVELDGLGRPETELYLLPEGYKFILTLYGPDNPADPIPAEAIVWTADNISDPPYVVFETLANVLAEGSRDVTDGYVIDDNDNTVTVLPDPTPDPCTVVLPAAGDRGFPLTIINLSTTVAVSVLLDGTDTVNGENTAIPLPAGTAPVFSGVTLHSDGVSNWLIAAIW